jgi:hypothetical protein
MIYIEHYNEQSFDWLTWRNGSLISILRIPHSECCIILNKEIIRKYAIGYCNAKNIPCRPKCGYIAVMFNVNSIDNFWTHLTIKEFESCFPELKSIKN